MNVCTDVIYTDMNFGGNEPSITPLWAVCDENDATDMNVGNIIANANASTMNPSMMVSILDKINDARDKAQESVYEEMNRRRKLLMSEQCDNKGTHVDIAKKENGSS